MADVFLEGASELDAVLKMLPEEIARKVVNEALLQGAKVTAAEMKARCPVGAEAHVYNFRSKLLGGLVRKRKAGYGRSQIRGRLAQKKEMGKIAEIVGDPRVSAAALAGVGSRAFYLKFIEFGWMLTSHGKRGRRGVKHIPAKPFLRPAWQTSKDKALYVIGQTLGKGIETAALKLAGPYSQSGFSKRGRMFMK